MHNADKDIIFQSLNAKLANYEAAEATDADWEQFAGAHKNQKRKGFWLKASVAVGLLLAVFAGILLSTTQKESTTPEPQQQDQPMLKETAAVTEPQKSVIVPTVVAQSTPTRDKDGIVLSTVNNQTTETSKATEPGENRVESTSSKPTAKISITANTSKAANEKPLKAAVEKANQPLMVTANQNIKVAPKNNEEQTVAVQNTTEETVLPIQVPTPETIESHQAKIGEAQPHFENLLVVIPSDSTKYIPRKIQPQNWFVDGGFSLIQSFNAPKAYPSDKYFSGAAVNVGRYLGKNWFVSGGVQYAHMNETNLVYVRNQQEQKEIISIDTSLKFVSAANRILMQVDTLSHTRIVETEKEYQLNSQRTWYAMPIMAGYEIGSPKRSLFMMVGITNILVGSQNTSLIKSETTEGLRTTTQHNFIVAPTIGIGAYQRIYKNLGIHCSGQYLYYLPNAITTQQSFQIQTGLRIKF
jgi:hypothetical protein